jgi:hypothetical protein
MKCKESHWTCPDCGKANPPCVEVCWHEKPSAKEMKDIFDKWLINNEWKFKKQIDPHWRPLWFDVPTIPPDIWYSVEIEDGTYGAPMEG